MPFCEHILNIPEAQGQPKIKPHRALDDVGRKPIAAVADSAHAAACATTHASGKRLNLTSPIGMPILRIQSNRALDYASAQGKHYRFLQRTGKNNYCGSSKHHYKISIVEDQ
jgi:hypothetical protein